jgi:hypothetical protein
MARPAAVVPKGLILSLIVVGIADAPDTRATSQSPRRAA